MRLDVLVVGMVVYWYCEEHLSQERVSVSVLLIYAMEDFGQQNALGWGIFVCRSRT